MASATSGSSGTGADIAALQAALASRAKQGQGSSASTGTSPSKTDTSAGYYECVDVISYLAILVIGITALAGSFSGHETMILGWTVAGSAVVGGVMRAMMGKSRREFLIGLFSAAMFVLFGVLGATGVFDATQLGWSIVGPNIAVVGLVCCLGSCLACIKMMQLHPA